MVLNVLHFLLQTSFFNGKRNCLGPIPLVLLSLPGTLTYYNHSRMKLLQKFQGLHIK